MRVTVDAGGRKVEIETSDTNVTPKDVAEIAMGMWERTDGGAERLGPATGFSSAERRGTRDVDPSSMYRDVGVVR